MSKKTKKQSEKKSACSSKRKRCVVILVLLALIVGFFIWFILTPKENLPGFLQSLKQDKKPASTYNPQPTTILYYTPDWTENIFDDEDYVYLIKDYVIEYKKGNVSVKFTDDIQKIEQYSSYAKFIYDYIETVKHGDNEAYNGYFFDEYFETHEKKQPFTMQKIYDLYVTEFDTFDQALASYSWINIDEDYAWAADKSLIGLEVRYKIRKNNGTFRIGIDHDVYQPELFILAYDKNGDLKIVDIVNKYIRGE